MKTHGARGVIFDKDGTLIEFEATWHPIMVRILAALEARFGLRPQTLEGLRDLSGIGPRGFARESLIQWATTSRIVALWEAFLLKEGLPLPQGALEALFEEASTQEDLGIRLVPGAEELLAYLKEAGWYLGLATSDARASTEHGLGRAGILGYFDFIAADGDGLPAKPDPTAARIFQESYNLDPGALAVFGDSLSDLAFAQGSGARFIGLDSGCNASEAIALAGWPVIQDFSDLGAVASLLA